MGSLAAWDEASIIERCYSFSYTQTFLWLCLYSTDSGGLGEPGSSSFVFEHKGVVQIPREELTRLPSCSDPLELAIEVGAEDIIPEEDDTDHVLLKSEPSEMRGVVSAVKEKGLTVVSATLEYLPKTPVSLPPKACARAEKLLELLSQHSDVVEVHSNFVSENSGVIS